MRADPHAMLPAGSFTIPPDHPALPGHFPGNPVVPGVVVLDHAAALIASHLPPSAQAEWRQVKFHALVLPGQAIETRYAPATAGPIAFACLHQGAPVATGTLVLLR